MCNNAASHTHGGIVSMDYITSIYNYQNAMEFKHEIYDKYNLGNNIAFQHYHTR